MNALRKFAVLLSGLLVLAVCGAAAADTADEAAIRTAGAAWDASLHAGKADAMAAVYADDAVLLPPTAPTAKGHAAIRKYLRAYVAKLAAGAYTPTVGNTVEIEISGDFGFRSGTYFITDHARAKVDTGKWLEIWRKAADGKWHIIRDIWNSDMLPLFPPDEPAAPGDTAQK